MSTTPPEKPASLRVILGVSLICHSIRVSIFILFNFIFSIQVFLSKLLAKFRYAHAHLTSIFEQFIVSFSS